MKINSIIISKFRSIKDAKFTVNDVLAIVGENNAGKTGILRALNSIFNFEEEKRYFIDKTHQFSKRSNSYISINFVDLPESLQSFANNGELLLEFKYEYSKNRRHLSYFNGSKKESISNADNFVSEINKYLTYVYIPAERTNRDIVWEEGTIFQKLLTSYLDKSTQSRDNISSTIRMSSKKIHDIALSKLEKELSRLYMQNKNIDFKIDFPSNIDYKAS